MNKKLFLFMGMFSLLCLSVTVFAGGVHLPIGNNPIKEKKDQPAKESSQKQSEQSSAKVTIAADGPVVDVCFSSDGSKIVFAYNNVINVYKTDGTIIKRFGIKDGPNINNIDYANNTIAAFAYTNPAQINIWDENGTNIKKLGAIAKDADETKVNPNIETAKSYRLLFSRDGKSLVNVSETDNFGGVKSRDLATGKVKVFKGYDDTSVYGCCFSVDGSRFVTMSRDEQVKVWDLAKGTLVTAIDTGDSLKSSYYGKDVAILSDGTIVAVKTDLTFWSSDGKLIKSLKKETDSSYTLIRASRDGNIFAVAFEGSGLALYSKDGTLLKSFQTEGQYSLPSAVTGIAFSPDNKFMAVATDGGDTEKGDVRIFGL
jgi:WD40 repeat protein